jgi:N-hydroxyarylamine O-acetyltransferase
VILNNLKYLDRIKYKGDLSVSPEVLNNLQKLHLLNIAFENLDIHIGNKIELKNTYKKIVNRGRGGFCYELNGLLPFAQEYRIYSKTYFSKAL